ncbi:AraC family transcriptional regulator [Sphingomonas sp. S6]|jgi:AraC-like DNA-binding protein|uniref:helix-turn-helix domain-containing protein n=1 Tax=Sphingomonas sp. S6 TaxID=3368600 RepID=UPI000FB87EB0|nr:AraC family transcriptional regulator [uncultured Sphingomonas sp.]RTL23459.1 MAG: AraC family transcriptional regulator [Sphingomonadaceae bacterium]
MVPRRRLTSAPLRHLASCYEERSAAFAGETLTHPLPARPDQFIEIYCADRYRVSHDGGAAEISPEVSLVGPHGRGHVRLLLAGEIRAFSIRLRPGTLHRLCGINMAELANRGVDLVDVLGPLTAELRDGVLRASDFEGRVVAAEDWLRRWSGGGGRPDQIDIAARLLLRFGGQVRIDRLASWAGLSERQFSRRFIRQIGLPAKLYARTIRLNTILQARQVRPEARWTDLAYAAGYADQAHFTRECAELTGAAPTLFFPAWARIAQT